MREKEEREEREGVGGAKFLGHGPSKARSGYVHNIDKVATSFYVSNFPDDLNMGDLWKIFARFGSLGDVYIPNKVDKWGKRFAFVKFKGVKDVDALSERLEDVWSGKFKLRVNKARFDRNDQTSRVAPPVENRQERGVERYVEKGSSFREALNGGKKVVEGVVPEESVLQVEVDKLVLEELQHSFVGVLALEVDVSRIRTTLYMEGRQHISVTLMGGKLVLLHSPKKGELEAMVKAKEDWLAYYFKEVKPWTPVVFNDRREVWVKVLGVPLHVWGESFFKKVGARFGEFLDFDEATASRARLDVARIKISTPCRGCIESLVPVSAMGSIFKVWVVEEKTMALDWLREGREVVEEQSFVDSVVDPGKAMVVHVGSNCSSGDAGDEGVGVDGDRISQPSAGDAMCQGAKVVLNCDEGRGQEAGKQADFLCALFKETSTSRERGLQGKGVEICNGEGCQQDFDKGEQMGVESNEDGDTRGVVSLTSFNVAPAGKRGVLDCDVLEGGSKRDKCGSGRAFSDPLEESMERVIDKEVERVSNIFCPEEELFGPCKKTTSCGPGGVFVEGVPSGLKNSKCRQVVVSAISESVEISIEGQDKVPFPYTQKTKANNKILHSQVGTHKCLQLAEVMKERKLGSRKKKGRKGVGKSHGKPSVEVINDQLRENGEEEGSSTVGSDVDVEPVFRAPVSGSSGVDLLLGDDVSQVQDSIDPMEKGDGLLQKEASKLLGIQKTVGFSFEMEDTVVCDKMVEDELRDRAHKVEREIVDGDQ
ncbi:hypothetical protein A2U01_0000333 [Trifolium medium]|uniref:RRM domain-containing protein n=1 Tax=Trifolium medium TaxID=97028 RepID=A0A392LX95_9FABA|nr:hypothetical protein [Trifolium medium]